MPEQWLLAVFALLRDLLHVLQPQFQVLQEDFEQLQTELINLLLPAIPAQLHQV